ncbi:MAG: ABC transporter ATP-binding protein [Clostridiales bacterium]|jgi:NitT/TauT family transport system ATP-binding protein|nr:ABC transporter ATP-binding protein [Clostridiales bacterium]
MGLTIKNIYKTFPSAGKPTLEDINLEISDGEFLCVTGPSGCGKTTLLNIIAGLETQTSGEILLDGNKITGAGPDRVVMFQESALFPWLTVIENIKFGLKLAGKQKAEQEEIAMKYLKLVQLAHFKDYRCHELSGGMKQRVALARALAMDSKILLMDEPFASLDKQTKNMLRDEIQKIWMQTAKTVFFITHSIEEALFFADRIVLLQADPGKVAGIFKVNLPRPRHIEEPAFIEFRAKLLTLIRKEVEKIAGQEYDNH